MSITVHSFSLLIDDDVWVDVCPADRMVPDRGIAALVGDTPVAVFLLGDGSLYVIDHVEPFTGIPVMARGLVGSVDDEPTVASPLHKQRFQLRTGVCLDSADHRLRTWPCRISGNAIQVASEPWPEAYGGEG